MCSATLEGVRLAGDRITLRMPAYEDASRLAALAADYDVAKNLARMPHPYGLEDAEGFLGRVANKREASDCALFIEHPTAGLIGCIGFHREPGQRWPEFGYWLARNHWGQGYASEAAGLALGWAADKGVRAAVAGHFVDNPASGRVLEKAGFLYTGDVKPRPCVARGEPQLTRIMAWLA